MAKDLITISTAVGGTIPDAAVRQGDSGSRELRLKICDREGAPLDLTGHMLTLSAALPGGGCELISGTITDAEKGEASVLLSDRMMLSPGVCVCELTLLGEDSSVLSTNSMRIAVVPSALDAGEITESDSFSALVRALARAEQYSAQVFSVSVNGGEQYAPDEDGNIDLTLTDLDDAGGVLLADDLGTPGNPPALDEDGLIPEEYLPLDGLLKAEDLGTAGNPPALDENGKLSADCLPLGDFVSYDALGTAGAPPALDANGMLPVSCVPLSGCVHLDDLGTAGNPPALDEDGMLPVSCVPLDGVLFADDLGTAGNPPVLDEDGKIPTANLPLENYIAFDDGNTSGGPPLLDANGMLSADCVPLDGVLFADDLDTAGNPPSLDENGKLSAQVIPTPEELGCLTEAALEEMRADGEFEKAMFSDAEALACGGVLLLDETVKRVEILASGQGATVRDELNDTLAHAEGKLLLDGEPVVTLEALGAYDIFGGEKIVRGTSEIAPLSEFSGSWSVIGNVSSAESGVCAELSVRPENMWKPDGYNWNDDAMDLMQMRVFCSHAPSCTMQQVIYPAGRTHGICVTRAGKFRIRMPLEFFGVESIAEVTDAVIKAALEENEVTVAYGLYTPQEESYTPEAVELSDGASHVLQGSGLPLSVSITREKTIGERLGQLDARYADALIDRCTGETVTLTDAHGEAAATEIIVTGQTELSGDPAPNAAVYLCSPADVGALTLKADGEDVVIPGVESLRGVAGACDTLEKKDGVWGIVRRVGMRVLDGTEEVSSISSGAQICRFDLTIPGAKADSALLCDRFEVDPAGLAVQASPIEGMTGLSGGKARVYIAVSRLETDDSEGIAAWLSDNQPTVLYALDTPVFEPLTSAAAVLCERLLHSKFTALSSDETVSPELTVVYRKNSGAVIAALLERIEALEEEIVEMRGEG